MTMPHYYVPLKMAWGLFVVGVAAVVMDPTVKVALIMSVPATLTLAFTVFTYFRGTPAQAKIQKSVDGLFTREKDEKAKIVTEKDAQTVLLTQSDKDLARAEGVAQGAKVEQKRVKK